MEFWIFMLVMTLLMPFVMIGFGRRFMRRAPQKINAIFGYRTKRSMQYRDTWEFAHRYCGKLWFFCGHCFACAHVDRHALFDQQKRGSHWDRRKLDIRRAVDWCNRDDSPCGNRAQKKF